MREGETMWKAAEYLLWIILWKGVSWFVVFISGCFGLANFTQVLLLASEKTTL